MRSLQSVLLVALGAVLIGAAFLLPRVDGPSAPPAEATTAAPTTDAAPTAPTNATSRFAALRAAESIADPLMRCIDYPVPERYRWSREALAAFCADELNPTLGWNEFHDAIEDGRSASIDSRLDALVEGYFAGSVPEGTLMSTYADVFGYSSAVVGRSIDRWMRDSPASAHALVAHGQHMLSTAYEARGEQFAADTAPAEMARMNVAREAAERSFHAALAKNPRLLAAHKGLILAAKLNGDRDLAQSALEQALAVDPKNFYVRAAMMQILEPRWGGSLEAMRQLADAAVAYRPKNPRLANLRAIALAHAGLEPYWAKDYAEALRHFDAGLTEGPVGFYLELADFASAQLGDQERAVELASQNLRFSPDHLAARTSRANHLTALGEFAWAESDLDTILSVRPRDPGALRARAQLLLRSGDDDAAAKGLKQLLSTNPRDRWAKQSLAWLYGYRMNRAQDADVLIGEMLEQEPESGELWLMRVKLLDAHPGPGMRDAVQSFLRHVDETSEEQRRMKPVAENWLSTHPG